MGQELRAGDWIVDLSMTNRKGHPVIARVMSLKKEGGKLDTFIADKPLRDSDGKHYPHKFFGNEEGVKWYKVETRAIEKVVEDKDIAQKPEWVSYPEYELISEVYRNKNAKRSKLPYMNHINEGLVILDWLDASTLVKKAYCLHPIFQEDTLFTKYGKTALEVSSIGAVILAMDYRTIANSYLSMHHDREPPKNINREVRMMLIADKIQNRKDFYKYGVGKMFNSDRLECYFADWLEALELDESCRRDLHALIQ